MTAHIHRVVIRIKMGIFDRVGAPGMTQHILADAGTRHFIQVRCGRVAKKMCVQMRVDAHSVGKPGKDRLHRACRQTRFVLG